VPELGRSSALSGPCQEHTARSPEFTAKCPPPGVHSQVSSARSQEPADRSRQQCLPDIVSTAVIPQPRYHIQGFHSKDSTAGIPLQGFRSRDSTAGIPQQRFHSRDSTAGIPQQGFHSRDSTAEIPQQRSRGHDGTLQIYNNLEKHDFLEKVESDW